MREITFCRSHIPSKQNILSEKYVLHDEHNHARFFYHPCCVWFLLEMLRIICIWPAVMKRCTTKIWYKNVTSNLKYVVYEQLMCFHCFHPSHATCHENKTKLIKSLQYFQTLLFQTCICSIWHLEEKHHFFEFIVDVGIEITRVTNFYNFKMLLWRPVIECTQQLIVHFLLRYKFWQEYMTFSFIKYQ